VFKLYDGVTVERISAEGVTEGVVVDMNSGRYLSLNEVALEMVEAIQQSSDEAAVVSRLLGRLDVDQATLVADLAGFKDQLTQYGLGAEEAA
jgi:hypothetical protein